MTRVLRWCGTEAAYRRHLLYRQVPCPVCTKAHRRYGASREKTSRALRELVATLALLFEEAS